METTQMNESLSQNPPSEPKAPRLRSLLRRKAKADAEAHAAALEMLLKALDAFSLTAPRAVMRVIPAVEDALEESVLSLGADNCVRGIRTTFFQDILRDVSQRGPGRELSRRQRAEWVRPLNAVREALQPLISVQLEPVANYARAPRAFAISARANAFLRPSGVQKCARQLKTPAVDNKTAVENPRAESSFVRASKSWSVQQKDAFSGRTRTNQTGLF